MRAILAPYDKRGLVDFARGLRELGWDLFATGNTERVLREANVEVTSVAELTGSPEMLGGRVKTLHPKVHGGLLYRRGLPEDEADIAQHGIEAIDLVAGNLYPFVETVTGAAGGEASLVDALDQIDIGGPTMIRAAAKNHPWVVPVIDPDDYDAVLEGLRGGGLDAAERRRLAAKAFQHVAHYDTMIAEYLRGEADPLPETLTVGMTRLETLRYGENPHQQGAFYRLDSVRTPAEGLGAYTQHHGKALSLVNVLDADAAFNLVADFEAPAVAIIKHTNPCCFATAGAVDAGSPEALASLAGLYQRALIEGDAVSAYGGIVAVNRTLDMGLATALREVLSPIHGGRMFFEIVIVPDAEPEALEHLKKKSRDLRILTAPLGDPRRPRLDVRAVRGGAVVQDADTSEETDFEVVSERQPTLEERADVQVAWTVCKHVKSNSITFVKDGALIGMGAGQPNRVQSARLCAEQAGERARGAVCASDAYIPFPDTIEVAAAAGVTAVVHPGGSMRDDESVAAANRLGVSLLTSGVRHFRH